MRQPRPAHPIMVLMRPDFGEPRIDQATPATSGGTNSGIRLAAATKPRHGVFVRTTIQEKVSPMMTASAVPPVHAISEFASARCTLGLPRTVMKLANSLIACTGGTALAVIIGL